MIFKTHNFILRDTSRKWEEVLTYNDKRFFSTWGVCVCVYAGVVKEIQCIRQRSYITRIKALGIH